MEKIETLKDYARDALQNLRSNLELYHQGVKPAYRVVAVQLRMLLCDTNRVHDRVVDVSLLPRVASEMRLHPLKQDAKGIIFDIDAGTLPLKEWLRQPVPGYEILTLRELIRTVSEQDGGAHVDLKPESPLWGYEERAEAVVKVGELVIADTCTALRLAQCR